MVVDGVVIVVPEEDGDREEGEIVDEFEMIMSSEDEEFKLRARIQQLEENNKDVERMEMMLSTNLTTSTQDNYEKPAGRYTQHIAPVHVLSDVSSLSDNDYESQRKFCKHKLKRLDSKRHEGTSRIAGTATAGGGAVNYRRHYPYVPRRSKFKQHIKQQQGRPKPSYNHHSHTHPKHRNYNSHYQEIISVDSMDEDNEIYEYVGDDDDEDDDPIVKLKQLKLSRYKLRVALAREGQNQTMVGQYKNSLKERLLGRRREKSPSPISAMHRNKEFKHESEMQLPELAQEADDDDLPRGGNGDQQEDPAELKLRLIALKSAILKKHLARKKRDAERAYSPTDMINRVHPTISNGCDIDDLMEISPAASPERVPSPPPPPPPIHFEQSVDTKPVDMDLVETDSDDPNRDSWNPWPSNYSSLNTAGGSFRCFMPNMQLPPVSMPIVIDDDEEEEMVAYATVHKHAYVDDDDEVAPPAPPFNIPRMQLDDMDDNDARDGLNVIEDHSHHDSYTDIQSISMDNSQTRKSFEREASDDEAGELRAMLLSNLKPARASRSPPRTAAPPPPLPPPPPPSLPLPPQSLPSAEVEHDSDDPEELRSLLLSSIASKKKPNVALEGGQLEISQDMCLKNAVKRFQTEEAREVSVPVSVPVPVPVVVVPPIVPPQIVVPAAPDVAPQPEVIETVSLPAAKTHLPQSASKNIIKIVKPNKVINKKTAIKRKIVTEEMALSTIRPSTLMPKDTSAPLHGQTTSGSSISSTPRLITTVDPGSIKVNRLVISLAETSAGSDDELELNSCYASYTNYTDNTSPLSLAMGSVSGSTTRSNTPNSEILDQVQSQTNSNPNLRRTVINEYFEKKLDEFLKQARSKVPTIAETEKQQQEQQDIEKVVQQKIINRNENDNRIVASTASVTGRTQAPKTTPGAVRHLPVASQKEYLRLIERMRLLEKRKLKATKPTGKPTIEAIATSETGKTAIETTVALINPPQGAANETRIPVEPSTSKAAVTQQSKNSRLKAFENSFNKMGGSMIANLDKSMQMVAEAIQSKITRLRCSHRLEELHAEMQAVKLSVKQEEAKLARIHPEIQASHEIIISLKRKRNKLYNAAMELGKGIRGDDYRLKDDDKPTIIQKASKLSKEKRLYNSIVKYDDLNQLVEHGEGQVDGNQKEHKQTIDDKTQSDEMVKEQELSTPTSSQLTEAPTIQLDIQTEEVLQPEEVQQPDEELRTEVLQPEKELQLEEEETTLPVQTDQANNQKSPKIDSPVTVRFMRELREDEEKDVVEEDPFKSKYLTEYRTPMSRNYNSQIDVNATICPFELMGRCEDGDCPYLHLSRVERTDATNVQ